MFAKSHCLPARYGFVVGLPPASTLGRHARLLQVGFFIGVSHAMALEALTWNPWGYDLYGTIRYLNENGQMAWPDKTEHPK